MKTNIHFRVEFDPYWCPYFVYVGCKHSKEFIISIFLFCFTIKWIYKDWMIKTDKVITLDDGRKFETWEKNSNYANEDVKTFALPKWW